MTGESPSIYTIWRDTTHEDMKFKAPSIIKNTYTYELLYY